MSTLKMVREVSKLAESMGFTVESLSVSKHLKFRLSRPEWGGVTKLLTVSVSHSDYRVMHRIKTDLRRMESLL